MEERRRIGKLQILQQRSRRALRIGASVAARRVYNRRRPEKGPGDLTMPSAAAKKSRPKYLSLTALLFEIRLPLPGWVSILHRASGALLFLAGVWLLFILDRSLASEAGFEFVKRYAGLPLVKLALLVLVWAYCHHFCAGIRYLLLDLDKGVDRASARASGVIVIAAGLALTAFFGVRMW
jgi:succinate dehydrogenase / fumarate reductase cytochrome b subunit